MDYSKITTPYIGNKKIKKASDKFRNKHWNKKLPINIEKIIDVSLKIDIIPIPNLEKICNTDALISSDWSFLYVDKDLFEDERRQNRLRFSYAHEIGHYVLHKKFYSKLQINSIKDFYNFIDLIPAEEYGYLETQANKFAGNFLVPRNLLEKELDKELAKMKKKIKIKDFHIDLLKEYLANPLSKKFGISPRSMQIILNEYTIE